MAAVGGMARGGSVVNSVAKGEALAQAMEIVGNTPRVRWKFYALRDIVGRVEHSLGLSHTNVGNMDVCGRTTAANKRV